MSKAVTVRRMTTRLLRSASRTSPHVPEKERRAARTGADQTIRWATMSTESMDLSALK
jgi:hypothetical protein